MTALIAREADIFRCVADTVVAPQTPPIDGTDAVAFLDDWLAGLQGDALRMGLPLLITELGLAYHLVTEFTSFIAIDRTRVVSNGVVRTVEQPSIVPEGVDAAAAGADTSPTYSSSSSSSSSGDSGSWFGGGGGGWGGGGPEDFEWWGFAFIALGALWLLVRRAFN